MRLKIVKMSMVDVMDYLGTASEYNHYLMNIYYSSIKRLGPHFGGCL